MLLHISPAIRISDLQRAFSDTFPFLRIEFYNHKIAESGQLPQHTDKCLGDYQPVITTGILDVQPGMKVKELEKAFKDQFKIGAQIFRSSGKFWLQTTLTNDWTLQKQNQYGMELSQSSKLRDLY
jgi:hypothetical protein